MIVLMHGENIDKVPKGEQAKNRLNHLIKRRDQMAPYAVQKGLSTPLDEHKVRCIQYQQRADCQHVGLLFRGGFHGRVF